MSLHVSHTSTALLRSTNLDSTVQSWLDWFFFYWVLKRSKLYWVGAISFC